MADVEPIEPAAPSPTADAPPAAGWKRDKAGREYLTVPGRRGPLYRRGEETISERLERDQRPKDPKPKAKASKGKASKGKAKQPPQPPAPADTDLRSIEQALGEVFQSPAMFAGLVGDVWLANHFRINGPRLARNFVVASEHNPWLRRQLETMASGGAPAMAVMTMIGLAGGIAAYAAPPLIYIFNLPAPEMARVMFDIPERRNGTAPPPAEAAAAPQAA